MNVLKRINWGISSITLVVILLLANIFGLWYLVSQEGQQTDRITKVEIRQDENTKKNLDAVCQVAEDNGKAILVLHKRVTVLEKKLGVSPTTNQPLPKVDIHNACVEIGEARQPPSSVGEPKKVSAGKARTAASPRSDTGTGTPNRPPFVPSPNTPGPTPTSPLPPIPTPPTNPPTSPIIPPVSPPNGSGTVIGACIPNLTCLVVGADASASVAGVTVDL